MATSSGQQLEPDKASSASQKVDNPEISIATTPQEAIGQNVYCPTRPPLKVTLLGSEWSSSAGGLSTLNRELAIYLSKHPKVEVSLLVPEGACKDVEKREAQSLGITVVDAKEHPGYEPLDWLSFPPEHLSMNIVVGHGVKLGRQGQVIRKLSQFPNCKWVQVVHTAPEDLSRHKTYADPISKGERKHQVEVDLCKRADLVVPVGPRLKEAYSSYLRRNKTDQDVFSVTPGLFDREFGDLKQTPNENAEFKVLLCGRGDDEDFELKGYNIAVKAFTGQQLKGKPYHLLFVGAPDGKQEEITTRLLQCGIAKEQLTVRKFIQSRDKMKDLLCEADLAIMPSKSEGFGLVALEALSAGLPILVGRKSGFAKALENVPIGHSCIVDSDDPTKWAEAIEAVRVRHGMRLEEIKALRASYEKKFSWKQQCEALVERMWRLVHGPSSENDNIPHIDSPFEQQFVAETCDTDCRTSEQQSLLLDEEKRASGKNNGAASSLSNKSQSLKNGSKTSISGSSLIPGTVINHSYQNLSDDKQEIVHEILMRQIQVYTQYHKVSTPDGVGALIEHIQKAYNLAVESVSASSLVIKVQCPTLESLESLWNDYCSGHLNEVAERYLVTDEIKRKLNLETVKLKTNIDEENYLICKKALMEKSREAVSADFSTEQTEPDQPDQPDTSSDFPKDEMAAVEKDKLGSPAVVMSKTKGKTLLEDVKDSTMKSDFPKDKRQEDLNWMARAEKAKASRAALHKASISGQYETVKMLLESGEDVEQKDEFSLTPLHLACWYGQESVVKLLLEHGADINALDRFQRTPLQKAEHHNHQSIVQLLLRSNANPSYQQPLSLKTLSKRAFLHVDTRSGFNRLQAAVFEGEDSIVNKASVFLDNFVKEVNLKTTRKGDILLSQKKKGPGHAKINKIYQEEVENENTLTDLHWCKCGENTEEAVELVLNYRMNINIPALGNLTPLLSASPSASSMFIKALIDLGADVNAQRTDDKATPLHLAASWNHYMATRLLLEHGADANIQDVDGSTAENTPLHLSVMNGHENIVKLLLENTVDVNIRDNRGYAPLHLSVINGHENLVKLLLENNANVNIQDNRGYAPLHLSAVRYGYENLVKLLLENTADVNIQDGYGDTPLHLSARDGHENLVKLLLENNADVDIQDRHGYTPLHLSIKCGHENLVKLFLEHNEDVNIQDSDGNTPLHLAARGGYENLIKLLLENTADVNIQDGYGDTPLHLSARDGHENLVKLLLESNADVSIQDSCGCTPLHWSIRDGHENLVKLLLENNANVNIQDSDEYTFLHWSVINGRENLVKLLLEHNADVNIQGKDGDTPLLLSVENGHENIVKLLLKHNADVNIQDSVGCTPLHLSVENLIELYLEHNADVNSQGSDGDTPLHLSVEKVHENLVKLLLEYNADVNIQDSDGYSPLHLSVENGHEKLVRLLLENTRM